MELSISNINKIVELIKQVDCTNSALVVDVAKELGVKKTVLMDFMNENPYLFKTNEIWTYKKVKHLDYYFKGKPQYTTMSVKDKPKGLAITCIYLDPIDNPASPEWLIRQQEQNSKTLFVKYWDNYGVKEGLYVNIDEENDSLRTGLWRNTKDKIQNLIDRKIIFPKTFYVGGFGDCTMHEVETATDELSLQKLIDEGWNIIYE